MKEGMKERNKRKRKDEWVKDIRKEDLDKNCGGVVGWQAMGIRFPFPPVVHS